MNNKVPSYVSVWNKYLPAIRIQVKKSAAGDQVLGMNHTDFEKAAGIRKSGYKFIINFTSDKPDTMFNNTDIVQAFINTLLGDEVIREHLIKNDYTFTFTGKYQLQIKNNSSSKQTEPPVTAEADVLTN